MPKKNVRYIEVVMVGNIEEQIILGKRIAKEKTLSKLFKKILSFYIEKNTEIKSDNLKKIKMKPKVKTR